VVVVVSKVIELFPGRKPERQPLRPGQRFRILARDNFTCRYCGACGHGVQLRVDHIIPVATWPNNADENLATACFECNAGKSDNEIEMIDPANWRLHLAQVSLMAFFYKFGPIEPGSEGYSDEILHLLALEINHPSTALDLVLRAESWADIVEIMNISSSCRTRRT
jgi:hypothetical protein